MAEPAAALVAGRAAMHVAQGLAGRTRWNGLARKPAASLGEPHTIGSIFDQAQHLESQALGGRQGKGRGLGDGAQDLVLLGAELDRMLPVHSRLTRTRWKKRPPNGGESGGRNVQPVVRFAGD